MSSENSYFFKWATTELPTHPTLAQRSLYIFVKNKASAIFINNPDGLDYLQAEIAVATREWPMSCICMLQMNYNKVDAVRSASP
jgi:hypothetical protein